jgi:hypothetical protein
MGLATCCPEAASNPSEVANRDCYDDHSQKQPMPPRRVATVRRRCLRSSRWRLARSRQHTRSAVAAKSSSTRQSQHPQEERKLAGAPPARDIPLHAHASILAEPGRGLVLDPAGQSLTGASFTLVSSSRSTSMPSSTTTMNRLSHSCGLSQRSTSAASKAAVLATYDSGY